MITIILLVFLFVCLEFVFKEEDSRLILHKDNVSPNVREDFGEKIGSGKKRNVYRSIKNPDMLYKVNKPVYLSPIGYISKILYDYNYYRKIKKYQTLFNESSNFPNIYEINSKQGYVLVEYVKGGIASRIEDIVNNDSLYNLNKTCKNNKVILSDLSISNVLIKDNGDVCVIDIEISREYFNGYNKVINFLIHFLNYSYNNKKKAKLFKTGKHSNLIFYIY